MQIIGLWVTLLHISEQTCSAKFTQEIKDTRAKENQRAKFEGHFTGNPMPEIVWEFDGKVLENSKEIEIKHSKNKTTLTFHEAKIENNGYYTCRVKNELGSDRTRAQLTVTSKFFLKKNKYLLYHNDSHIVMTFKLDLPIPDATSIYWNIL